MTKSNSFTVAGKTFNEENVFIVAEIGKNFIQTQEEKSQEEYIRNAKELIVKAKESGADAVKFQTHIVEDEQLEVAITSPHFPVKDRYNWIKRVTQATPKQFWLKIKKLCEDIDIVFFSTPMSRAAAATLEDIGIQLWKIGSGDILDFVMLDFIASTKKTIILSTGMSTVEEIDNVLNFLKKRNVENIILLHCVSKYPCPSEELNLRTISYLRKRYGLPVGFSDHSLGCESAVAAVKLSAVAVEKHFTLDRNSWGPDHKFSMLPADFKMMVDSIRNKESVDLKNFGREEKILQDGEAVFREIFRKTLVAGKDIEEGTRITTDLIYAMRPQNYKDGLPSEKYESVLGRKTKRYLKKYTPIKFEDLE